MKSTGKILVLLSIIISNTLTAQQEWKWLLGGGGENNDIIYAVTYSSSNTIYVAGGFRDQATIAGEVLTSHGDNDIFLAAFDTLGNKIWLKQEGAANFEWANCIVTDDNYLYIAGSFKTSSVIGGEPIDSYNENTEDIFIAKYDLNGDFQWVKTAGGIQDDKAEGIALDDESNIYITGPINHTAYFDDITVNWQGFSDLFVAKYSDQGDCLWAKGYGGASYDYAFAIAVDHDNNPVIAGRFYETVMFGPHSLTSIHDADAFLLKCTAEGEETWVRQAGGQYHDHPTCLTIDSQDNYYIAGWYMGDISFNGNQHVTAGGMDIFIAKYDTDGNYQWSESYGDIEIDEATSLSCSSDDEIIMAGEFHFSLNFGTITLTAQAYYDGFVTSFNTDGEVNWAEQLKSAGNIDLRGGTLSLSGDYYAAGGFLDDITAGTHHMNSIGSLDYYLARLGKASSAVSEPGFLHQHVLIYPNPAVDYIYIQWNDNSIPISIKLSNMIGHQILSCNIQDSQSCQHRITLDGLTPGVYIAEIIMKKPVERLILKVVKE